MKNFFFFLSIAFMLTSSLLLAQNSKDEIFNKVSQKYSNIKSVQINFASKDSKNLSGSIKAKKGNKYILMTAEREIICDGKTIWNYDFNSNKVIKSLFEANNSESSLENIFFSLIKDYHPDNLYNENSSKAGNSFLVLVLKPKDEKKKISGVKEIKLYLDSKTYDIQSIYSTVKNKTQGWTINKIITNVKFPDSLFKFKVPKNAKFIDLK
jgi:outer membrane lipoprotein carrier protein